MRLNPRRALIALACAAALAASAPPALAGPLSDFAENALIDAIMRGQAFSPPATLHWGFTTDLCTDAGPGTEPSGGAYARVAVAASLANWAGTQGAGTTVASTGTGATTSNNVTITWPTTTASWSTLLALRAYDAATAGNQWLCFDLVTPFDATSSGITINFAPAQLQFYIDTP